MLRKVLNETRDLAIQELKTFILETSVLLEKQGWEWFLSADREVTEKFRPELALLKRIPLTPDGNTHTIYGPTINMLNRFWHDVTHLSLGLGYDRQDELVVIGAQLRQLQEAGLSQLALEIFWYDMWGQTEYYEFNREFVVHQDAFVDLCLQRGINRAIRVHPL